MNVSEDRLWACAHSHEPTPTFGGNYHFYEAVSSLSLVNTLPLCVTYNTGAAGCSAAPAHASSHGLPIPLRRTRAGLAQSLPRQHAAVRVISMHANVSYAYASSSSAARRHGSSAKRALRAAAPPVPDTAGRPRPSLQGRQTEAQRRFPRRGTRKVTKANNRSCK